MDNIEPIIGLLTALAGVIGALVALVNGGARAKGPDSENSSTPQPPQWAHALLKFSLVLFFLGAALVLYFFLKDISTTPPPPTDGPTSETTYGTTVGNEPSETEKTFEILPIGSIYEFGTYEQDGKEEKGPEPIEWIVLSQEDDKVLLLSVLGLDARPFADGRKTSTWSSSSIEDWLNGTFYLTAFSDAERKQILETEVLQNSVAKYPRCDQGEDTTNYVFLLSVEEYEEYMYNGNIESEYRKGTPSPHLVKSGLELTNDTYCWWWLRTSSQENETAYAVSSYGVLDPVSHKVYVDGGMIRPAIWITITE